MIPFGLRPFSKLTSKLVELLQSYTKMQGCGNSVSVPTRDGPNKAHEYNIIVFLTQPDPAPHAVLWV